MKKPARVWRSLRWSGCNLAAWVRLLARQQYAFDPSFWPAVVRTTVNCALSSALGFIDEFVHGAAVRQTRLHEAPLFVLGHWRSGTTFLHDLLSLDERYIFADHLSTYFPSHFLLTGDLIRRRMGTAATHRRMDNVPISLDTPAEDEFALCLTGTPSPYLDMAFPNRPQIYRKYLDMVGVSPRGRAAWKRSWRRFLQRLTYRRPGRLLLKSPTHTARIKLLLEVFPDARFVHIVRNPYVVFSSTHKMILAMTTELSLQEPPFPALDEEIFTGYLQLMGRLEEDLGPLHPQVRLRRGRMTEGPRRNMVRRSAAPLLN
jgi:hypothetical protein